MLFDESNNKEFWLHVVNDKAMGIDLSAKTQNSKGVSKLYMNDTITPAFQAVAESVSTAGARCVFTENDAGGLIFRFESRIEDERTFTALVFGSLLTKLRKGLKPFGYTLAAKPTIKEGVISVDLWQSSFHGKLSDLIQGFQTEGDFIKRTIAILSEKEIDPRQLTDAIAMLNAVEAARSGGVKAANLPTVQGAEPS